MTDPDLARAQREAELARERMLGTLHDVQARLSPASLAEDVVDSVRDKGVRAVGLAKRYPAITAATSIGLAALLARRPLRALIGRWRGRR